MPNLDCRDLAGCYVVKFGDAFLSNDGAFAVVERGADIVVTSADRLLTRVSREAVADLIAAGKVWSGHAWMPPTAWRKKAFGLVALPAIAEGVFPKAALDKAKGEWGLRQVHNLSEIDDVLG